jgi:uncharacterized protein (TIGR03435 family)
MVYKLTIALIACGVAFAQSPAFEVATIKPSEQLSPQAMMAGKIRFGEKIDGARADYGYTTVEFLLTKAYGVKDYQVQGPAWIKSERYDVTAKLPEGATKEQIPDMLKTLLKERFRIELHHETKEHAVFALVVGKTGAKLNESAEEKAADPDAKPAAGTVSMGGMSVTPTAGGRGATVKGAMGNITVTPGENGTMHMAFSQMTMAAFVDLVSKLVDKPVIDQTEMKGKYDVALDMGMADMMNMARAAGVGMPGMGMGGGRGPGGSAADAASDPSGGSIFQTVQGLGLKLEPKKLPLDTIVVDKGEKVPTEN